jgi:acid phosphatase class B
VLIVIYTDDTIVTSPDEAQIDKASQGIGHKFKITSKNNVNEFLGVKIDKDENGKIMFLQPQLIDSILLDLNLDDKSNLGLSQR